MSCACFLNFLLPGSKLWLTTFKNERLTDRSMRCCQHTPLSMPMLSYLEYTRFSRCLLLANVCKGRHPCDRSKIEIPVTYRNAARGGPSHEHMWHAGFAPSTLCTMDSSSLGARRSMTRLNQYDAIGALSCARRHNNVIRPLYNCRRNDTLSYYGPICPVVYGPIIKHHC